MGIVSLLFLGTYFLGALAFLPPLKEQGLSEALLREVVDRMGQDLDTYFDESGSDGLAFPPQLMAPRSYKDNPDYQDNPMIPRDQEYLHHSSLWANPFMRASSDDSLENELQKGSASSENKQYNLPAYCNPPNPCPVGYTSEEGCIEEFENTAQFSREYQARQDCMCDSEHMFDCSSAGQRATNDIQSDLDRIVQQLHANDDHKGLLSKKFAQINENNPYLTGEKLPVAAKKGNNINY